MSEDVMLPLGDAPENPVVPDGLYDVQCAEIGDRVYESDRSEGYSVRTGWKIGSVVDGAEHMNGRTITIFLRLSPHPDDMFRIARMAAATGISLKNVRKSEVVGYLRETLIERTGRVKVSSKTLNDGNKVNNFDFIKV